MTAYQLDRRFLSFREYIDRRILYGLSDEQAPPYAHPVDERILRALESTPAKAAIEKAIDAIISLELGQYLANGIFIDGKSFPDLFEVLTHCSKTLGISTPHALASSSPDLFNAFTAGTDEYSFISITSGLCEYYSREEAAFVVGHECGHIAARHMVYHTLAWAIARGLMRELMGISFLLAQVAFLPLLAWARRSEVTADRAGLLCCGDIAVAERALIRLIAGHADADRIDVDDYLHKAKEMSEYHGISNFQQALTTHPVIPKRIEALRLFARSELYYDLSERTPPADVQLLSREDLDRKVNGIVKP